MSMPDSSADTIARIGQLFVAHGARRYEGVRSESVTALAHALQCAQLAESAEARPSLVAAAFLHDIGHFLPGRAGACDIDDIDDTHELRALPFLNRCFGREVTEPIRLHVPAKRYLVAVDGKYFASLSAASVHSLGLQGGAMTQDEARLFEALPYATDAIALRRWDDLAKEAGRATLAMTHYLTLLGRCVADPG